MFDLEKEVNAWVDSSVGSGCLNSEIAAEVKDHLYCEIEKNLSEGLSEQSAFWAATRRMGLSDDIRKEFGKISQLKQRNGFFSSMSTKQLALFNAVFLFCFAGFVFGSAFALKGTGFESYVTPISYVLMFVPILLALDRNRSRQECTVIKKWIGLGRG